MNMGEQFSNLTLQSDLLEIVNIVKRTNAQYWRQLEVGDQIIIRQHLKHEWYARGGFVPKYEISCPSKDLKWTDTHNNLINRLNQLDLKNADFEDKGILSYI